MEKRLDGGIPMGDFLGGAGYVLWGCALVAFFVSMMVGGLVWIVCMDRVAGLWQTGGSVLCTHV